MINFSVPFDISWFSEGIVLIICATVTIGIWHPRLGCWWMPAVIYQWVGTLLGVNLALWRLCHFLNPPACIMYQLWCDMKERYKWV